MIFLSHWHDPIFKIVKVCWLHSSALLSKCLEMMPIFCWASQFICFLFLNLAGTLFCCSICNFECFCSPICKPLLAGHFYNSFTVYETAQKSWAVISFFTDKDQCIKKCWIKWAGIDFLIAVNSWCSPYITWQLTVLCFATKLMFWCCLLGNCSRMYIWD